jgi:hypothetical protein
MHKGMPWLNEHSVIGHSVRAAALVRVVGALLTGGQLSLTRLGRNIVGPDRTPQRQILIIKHPEGPPPRKRENRDAPTKRMRWKFDTPLGREIYSRRMGTVEPVFANIQNKGMRRFTLRGQKKVSAQWKLFKMVHNIPNRPDSSGKCDNGRRRGLHSSRR